MNTIKREIIKRFPTNSDPNIKQARSLTFEGEKGKFDMMIESFNPFEGTQRVSISLDKEDALVLYKSLSNFLDVPFKLDLPVQKGE